MDQIRVEYRGVAGELSAGDTVIVESCEAGVLLLRRASAKFAEVAADKSAKRAPAKKEGTSA